MHNNVVNDSYYYILLLLSYESVYIKWDPKFVGLKMIVILIIPVLIYLGILNFRD
jgi:hypothetical protein